MGKTDKHNDVVYGVHTTRGILSGSPSYPIRSVRTQTHKYIWNLQYDAPFRNTLIAGSDKAGYWRSWVERAKTDKMAARLVDGYQRRPEVELYDLRNDPYELNNLADDPAHEELKAKLRGQLIAWMKQQGDLGIETELDARSRQGRGQTRKKSVKRNKKRGI